MSKQERAPFHAGQTVKRKGGETGTVIRCEASGRRFRPMVVGITRPGQGRDVQWWASNCELVAERPEWPKYFEPTDDRGRSIAANSSIRFRSAFGAMATACSIKITRKRSRPSPLERSSRSTRTASRSRSRN